MTVVELVEKLLAFEPNLEVYINDGEYGPEYVYSVTQQQEDISRLIRIPTEGINNGRPYILIN